MGPAEWAALAATISAMCDVYRTGRDAFEEFFQARLSAPEASERGTRLAAAMSTYSDEEVDAINERLNDCRERFIREGSGKQRAKCLCSVLKDVKDGNGGEIPFDDWGNIYRQLGC